MNHSPILYTAFTEPTKSLNLRLFYTKGKKYLCSRYVKSLFYSERPATEPISTQTNTSASSFRKIDIY